MSTTVHSRVRERGGSDEPTMLLGCEEKWPRTAPEYLSIKDKLFTLEANGRFRVPYERCYDINHGAPPYLTGGPLSKWDLVDGGTTLQNFGVYDGAYAGYDLRYTGGFVCNPYAPSHLLDSMGLTRDDLVESFGDSSAYGAVTQYSAEAWNRMKPGVPGADLAVFIAEIKDVPRMLWKSADIFRNIWKNLRSSSGRGLAKEAAEQHLNTQFGWLPFVGDCRKLYNTYKNVDKRLAQIARDNNQWVRRKCQVRKDVETLEDKEEHVGTAHYPALGSSYRPWPPIASDRYYTSIVRNHHVWACGRFKYYIPDIGSVKWRRRAVRKLFGLRLTPDVLWELIPFSWLVDYFANVGDVLAAKEDGLAENLVAKYAYIMGTTTTSLVVDSTQYLSGGPINASWSYDCTKKVREPANPFGFGLTSDDLSARQWGILSALGISKFF